MPFISTADVISLLFLLALQERRSQVTPQPIRRPVTASTAASHTGTSFVQSQMMVVVVLVVVGVVVLEL